MTTAANAIRWLEHFFLIILLAIVIALVAPLGRVSGANSGMSVTSEVLTESSEVTEGMVGMLPDLATIYRTAVVYPYKEARETITDPELLDFFDGFVKATGLS